MIESFLTIEDQAGPFEFKEKGSRFISFILPVKDTDEIDTVLAAMRRQFYDSTHVCFAFRLGEGETEQFRYSDDGEPSGTAGLPIYKEIKRGELFNVLVISVRYYGGTKLGTGGLTRAYGKSGRLAVDNVSTTRMYLKKNVTITVPFDFIGSMMHLINLVPGTEIDSQDYGVDGVNFILRIPVAQVDNFSQMLTEKSNGLLKFNAS